MNVLLGVWGLGFVLDPRPCPWLVLFPYHRCRCNAIRLKMATHAHARTVSPGADDGVADCMSSTKKWSGFESGGGLLDGLGLSGSGLCLR